MVHSTIPCVNPVKTGFSQAETNLEYITSISFIFSYEAKKNKYNMNNY